MAERTESMGQIGRVVVSGLRGAGKNAGNAVAGRRGTALAAAELLGLSAIVIAQPIFDALERSTWAFSTEGVWGFSLVLFACALVILPAVVLLGLELIFGLLGREARGWIHLLWVGGLIALFAWQAVADKGNATSGGELLVLGVGLLAIAAYARFDAARQILRYLGLGAPVVIGLFLFTAPIDKFALASSPSVPEPAGGSKTPVVLVIFDEFPLSALLDSHGGIDRGRFPHFAELAAGSDWFENALTVSGATEQAVPAILSGDFPEPDALAIYGDHPRNIFTLLAPTGERLNVVETVTDLCPPSDCSKGNGSLISRYAHLLRVGVDTAQSFPMGLPARIVRRIDSWYPAADRNDQIDRFVRGLQSPGDQGSLSVLHIGLPHVPYEYFPSGRRYITDGLAPRGTATELWSKSRGYPINGLQRMMLQIGYADRVLGRIITRMRQVGLYQRSVFAVVADHGAAFFPGHSRRLVEPTNAGTILRVPMFIKRPDQKRGRVFAQPVRTIDLFPTIAQLIDVKIPWKTDGSAIYGPPREWWGDARMQKWQQTLGFSRQTLSRGFEAALRQRQALVGQGSVFTLGISQAALRGKLDRAEPVDFSVQSPGGTTYDRNWGVYPALIYGSLLTPGVEDGKRLIVTMNGRPVAIGYSVDAGTKFVAILPPSAFHSGRNRLQLYAPR
ncbi:MAG: sulfatase-like hydrolase/transferase [Solirubrobacterales bacterium]